MQFYEEFDLNITNDFKFGKLDFDNKNFLVNDQIIENNRAVINDIVYINENKVVNVKERSNETITGILYLDSKIKYGTYNKKQLFLFKPTNKKYSNFYVPCDKKINYKVYCNIKFKRWSINDKLPIGELINTIGKIGIFENEIEHLKNLYKLNNKVFKIDSEKNKSDTLLIENLQSYNEDYEVFSIDPEGSKDIDDAFHFKKIDDRIFEIGIHIACPTKLLKDQLEIVLDRVSTIYTPIKNINMIPVIYSENLSSLLENKKRYSLSLILKIENYEIKSYELKECIIKNTNNYNYDKFMKIYKKNKNLLYFYDFSKTFFNKDLFDSHMLVELWMIKTNKIIAQHLINLNLSNIILRTHQKSNNLLEIKNKELFDYLNIRNEKSANYELFDLNKNQYHSKLNNEYYTHFTSPIRRSIDFFIHYLLLEKKDIFEKEKLEIFINNINLFTKNLRKFDRNINRLKFLFECKEEDKEIITYGYIIEIKENSLKIYIPEYKLEEKIIFLNRKFNKISNVKIEYENENIEKITCEIDNIIKIYNLYQKIDIKLWIFLSFENIFDKLKLEIL